MLLSQPRPACARDSTGHVQQPSHSCIFNVRYRHPRPVRTSMPLSWQGAFQASALTCMHTRRVSGKCARAHLLPSPHARAGDPARAPVYCRATSIDAPTDRDASPAGPSGASSEGRPRRGRRKAADAAQDAGAEPSATAAAPTQRRRRKTAAPADEPPGGGSGEEGGEGDGQEEPAGPSSAESDAGGVPRKRGKKGAGKPWPSPPEEESEPNLAEPDLAAEEGALTAEDDEEEEEEEDDWDDDDDLPDPFDPGLGEGDEEEYFEVDVGSYVEWCQETYGIEDLVGFVEGPNGCPAIRLMHPSGHEAEVNMHGANVTGWWRQDGTNLLYLRPDTPLDGEEPILGGVPLIFPQYGRSSGIVAYAGAAMPTVPTDGFLNRLHWSVVESATAPEHAADPAPTVSLTTMATPETYELWPYFFEAMYTVSLMHQDDFTDPRTPPPGYTNAQEGQGVEDEDADDEDAEDAEDDADADSDADEEADGDDDLAWASAAGEDGEDPLTAAGPRRGKKQEGETGDEEDEEDEEGEVGDEDEEEEEEGVYTLDAISQPVQLRCVLQIANRDEKPMTFTAGLKAHAAVKFMQHAELNGLQGKFVLDCDADPEKPWIHIESNNSLTFGSQRMERVYIDAAGEGKGDVILHPGNYRYRLKVLNRKGFRDMGVWNPHVELAAWDPSTNRLNRSMHREFIAIPMGAFARPVTLQPGETWVGEMVLRSYEQEHLWPAEAARWEETDPMRPPEDDESPVPMP